MTFSESFTSMVTRDAVKPKSSWRLNLIYRLLRLLTSVFSCIPRVFIINYGYIFHFI